eukprot:664668-Prorocentrum_minimum.AAC.2
MGWSPSSKAPEARMTAKSPSSSIMPTFFSSFALLYLLRPHCMPTCAPIPPRHGPVSDGDAPTALRPLRHPQGRRVAGL